MKETQRTVQWRVAGAEAAVDRTVRVAPLKEGQVRHEEGVSQHRLEEEAVKAKVYSQHLEQSLTHSMYFLNIC